MQKCSRFSSLFKEGKKWRREGGSKGRKKGRLKKRKKGREEDRRHEK